MRQAPCRPTVWRPRKGLEPHYRSPSAFIQCTTRGRNAPLLTADQWPGPEQWQLVAREARNSPLNRYSSPYSIETST